MRGGSEITHRTDQTTASDQSVEQPFTRLDTAITDHDVAAYEPFGHQRKPFVGNRITVGRRKDDMLVTTGLDADRQRQLDAVFVMGLLLDTGHVQPRFGGAHIAQDLADLLVVAAIDHDDLEIVVLLCEQQGQTLFDEVPCILPRHDHHRNRRRRHVGTDTPVVAEPGQSAVNAQIVIHLHGEHRQGSAQQSEDDERFFYSISDQIVTQQIEILHHLQ